MLTRVAGPLRKQSRAMSSVKQELEALTAMWRKAYGEAGFVQRTVKVESGEIVSYLERPQTQEKPNRTCVFLHGMTSDGLGSASGVTEIAPYLSKNDRILVPDAPGHGQRRNHTLANYDSWNGFTREEHVADLKDFLKATGADNSPLDLVGYSMGGGTAYEFASKFPTRVRTLSLLAPGLILNPDQVESTVKIRKSRKYAECVYNYRTEEEAAKMMRLVGYHESIVPMLARVTSSVRQEVFPPEYWWRMWDSFAWPQGETRSSEILKRQRDRLEAHARSIRRAQFPVLVVQGSEELVINQSVPPDLLKNLGPTCEVSTLDGCGHRGHPSDPSKNYLTLAGQEVGQFLKKKGGPHL